MKSKQKKEIRTKSNDELLTLLGEERKSLLSLLMDHSQFTLKSPSLISMKRKEIAYIQTVMQEKEKEESASTQVKAEK
ncbi:MAG TPA: 50S ribosomal protein L29 [Patescibacteria group bacterium]|nr:50S ribosomal protein L29 [Patescibacteria group bacterium]